MIINVSQNLIIKNQQLNNNNNKQKQRTTATTADDILESFHSNEWSPTKFVLFMQLISSDLLSWLLLSFTSKNFEMILFWNHQTDVTEIMQNVHWLVLFQKFSKLMVLSLMILYKVFIPMTPKVWLSWQQMFSWLSRFVYIQYLPACVQVI